MGKSAAVIIGFTFGVVAYILTASNLIGIAVGVGVGVLALWLFTK